MNAFCPAPIFHFDDDGDDERGNKKVQTQLDQYFRHQQRESQKEREDIISSSSSRTTKYKNYVLDKNKDYPLELEQIIRKKEYVRERIGPKELLIVHEGEENETIYLVDEAFFLMSGK